MALRRGGSAGRLLYALSAQGLADARVLRSQLSPALSAALSLHAGFGGGRRGGGGGGNGRAPPPPPPGWHCWALDAAAQPPAWRHLSTTAERRDEAAKQTPQQQQSMSTTSSATAEPDAAKCDAAIARYARIKQNTASLRYPSTYKTVTQRVIDLGVTAGNFTVAALKWTVRLPPRLWALRLKSRDDWARDWAHVKKVVKEEAHHYWVGFKLLAYETRVASGLALKAARGDTLSRRERRQLMRTTADLFRLVPMIIILVVPFMELALPLLLKVFPNMLPSTFEDKLKKEEELKRRLGAKLEVARFLQDTVAEMAKDIKSKRTGEVQASAEELYKFMNKVRAGAQIGNDELVRFASLFNDELTLDALGRVQLVSMCQFLGIPPFGTDAFLASRLRAQLLKIKRDDVLIQAEGVDAMTEDELRSACRARGMKPVFGEGAGAYMRASVRNWLDLSLNRGLPSSLLLLSQAFAITTSSAAQKGAEPGAANAPRLEGVKETLATLPENVIKDVGLEVAVPTSGAEELQKRLDLIAKEQKLIAAEEAARKLESAAIAAAAAAGPAAATPTPGETGVVGGSYSAEPQPADASSGAAAARAAAVAAQEAQAAADAQYAAASAAAAAVINEAAAGVAKDAAGAPPASGEEAGVSAEEREAAAAAAREARMRSIISAIAVLASNSGVAAERARFMDLVGREINRLKADAMGAGSPSLRFTGGALTSVRPEDALAGDDAAQLAAELAAPKRLEDRVSGILTRIEKELDEAEGVIGEGLHVLDLDGDGLISRGELSEALRFLRANLDEDELRALLDRLNIRPEAGADAISVDELLRISKECERAAAAEEEGEGGGDGDGEGGDDKDGKKGGGGGGAAPSGDSARIHVM